MKSISKLKKVTKRTIHFFFYFLMLQEKTLQIKTLTVLEFIISS